VPDKNNSVTNVVFQYEAQGVRGPSNQVLQRFTTGEAHQMRSRKPFGEKLRVSLFNIFVGFELP